MMPTSQHDTEILILGAGMAGLSAATELQRAGRLVLVLDKGRSVGGRMATRRLGEAVFDHGAQFMTARSARFQATLGGMVENGVVVEWCRGFTETADGHPRWRGHPGMTAVPKLLAKGVEVRLEKQIASLSVVASRWLARTKDGETFAADALLLTAPVQQSLALLDTGAFALTKPMRTRLEAIEYERCLAVMAVLDGPSRIPSPGGRQFTEGPITWLADNQLKGISLQPAVTIHASHAFSVEHWESDRKESGRELLRAAAPWLGAGVKEFQVHAWRYSKPLRVEECACLLANEAPPLIFAGDAFAGSKVEGAALSGWAAAELLRQWKEE
jgi:predicted NAD/FAD-dependent oxidoreductase